MEMRNPEDYGVVYLVGAGPGDPGLITVRGRDLIRDCDALVYDSLVAPQLILECPALTRIYVGKTRGGHALKQEEISQLLVDLATQKGGPRRIVRLKGGDPYMLARGGEEALACIEAGVKFEVVPGVTAGIAAPAYAGVPVTHRSFSRGAIFITGHRKEDQELDLPWEHLAKSGLTLVFYMGVTTLPAITKNLMEAGMPGDMPAIIIQEGTTPGQRVISAPLNEIATAAQEAGIRPPSISLIGKVADLASTLQMQAPKPLAGKTVVLLKAAESQYPELDTLRNAGARVLEASVLKCIPRTNDGAVSDMLQSIVARELVLFTSALAARFFAELWFASDSRPQPQFIAATRSIKEEMLRCGFSGVIAPSIAGRGESLKAIQHTAVPQGTRIWLPRASVADDELPNELSRAGYHPQPVALYDTVTTEISRDVQCMLEEGRADVVALLSGTTVTSLLTLVPRLSETACLGMRFAAIGEKAAAVARVHGIDCTIVPDRPRMDAFMNAILLALLPEHNSGSKN